MKEITIKTNDHLAFISLVNLAKSFGDKVKFITKSHGNYTWDVQMLERVASLLKCPIEKLPVEIQDGIQKHDIILIIRGIRKKRGIGLFEAKQLVDLL